VGLLEQQELLVQVGRELEVLLRLLIEPMLALPLLVGQSLLEYCFSCPLLLFELQCALADPFLEGSLKIPKFLLARQ
jgi:hypothetical protein